MMDKMGREVVEEYEWGENVTLLVLEDGEIWLEFDSPETLNASDLKELGEWFIEKSATIAALGLEAKDEND